MSTHAHEYGFPSSHSTNSVTIALFFAHFIWERQDSLGSLSYGLYMLLAVYAISVVGGRLYTGMHSTGTLCDAKVADSVADIIGGSIMGFLCWIICLFADPHLETWIASASTTCMFRATHAY